MYKINEIVQTIHGEQPFTGLPCLLVRFSGCDIKCPYCDTDHSKFNLWEPEKLVRVINESKLKSVLITGGEPFIQEELDYLIEKVRLDKKIVIETNGNALISNEASLRWLKVTLVMDVKLFDNLKYFNPINLTKLNPGDVIKFVFWDYKSFSDAATFLEDNISRLPHEIIATFSPTVDFIKMGKTPKVVDRIIELQERYPFIRVVLQVQLHKILGVK